MTAFYYAQVLTSLAGFALAIAGALSAWATFPFGPFTVSSGAFAAGIGNVSQIGRANA